MQEMQVRSLGREDPLVKEMATYSSILARIIPCIEGPGGLQSMGLQRVRHDLGIKQQHLLTNLHVSDYIQCKKDATRHK